LECTVVILELKKKLVKIHLGELNLKKKMIVKYGDESEMIEKAKPSAVYLNNDFDSEDYGKVAIDLRDPSALFFSSKYANGINILFYVPEGDLNPENPLVRLAGELSRYSDINVGISESEDYDHAHEANVIVNYNPDFNGLRKELGEYDEGKRVILDGNQFGGKRLDNIVKSLYSQLVEKNAA
jgi:hypothetical protein